MTDIACSESGKKIEVLASVLAIDITSFGLLNRKIRPVIGQTGSQKFI
jgi:hypothetical protein